MAVGLGVGVAVATLVGPGAGVGVGIGTGVAVGIAVAVATGVLVGIVVAAASGVERSCAAIPCLILASIVASTTRSWASLASTVASILGVGATSAGVVEQPMAATNRAIPITTARILASFIPLSPGLCESLKLYGTPTYQLGTEQIYENRA